MGIDTAQHIVTIRYVLNKVIRLSQDAYEVLEAIRKKQKLTTISDAVFWLYDSDLRKRVERLEKQIALLLQQQGGAGEGDQASE